MHPSARSSRATGIDRAARRIAPWFAALLMAGSAAAVAAPTASAAHGDLDTTFSGDGLSSTRVGAVSDLYLRSSGKVVSVGTDGSSIIVEKRRRNGKLDTTFGTNGRFTYSKNLLYPGLNAVFDRTVLVAGQGDSILVAFSYNEVEYEEGSPVTAASSHILRLTGDGAIDKTFGTRGVITMPTGTESHGRIVDLVVDAAGRIAVLQQRWTPYYAERPNGCPPDESCDDADEAALIRLSANGTAIIGFGSDGVATIASPPGRQIEPIALTRASQKWSVLYETFEIGVDSEYFVRRFDDGGTVDNSFGTGGDVELSMPGETIAPFDMVTAPGRGLVIGADLSPGPDGLALIALDADGDLETGFSGDGIARILKGRSTRGGEIVADAERIYVTTAITAFDPKMGGVVAFRRDGSVARSFGTKGRVTFPLTYQVTAVPAAALWADHPALLVGVSEYTVAGAQRFFNSVLRSYAT